MITSQMEKKIKEYLMSPWRSSASYRIRKDIFNFKEKLTGYTRLKKTFKERNGYELDLKNPKSYNQKISWKKIYDRNPVLPVITDKYLVREYLKDKLGVEEAEKILIPLLYVTDKPETIPFDDLFEEYIIKANHCSGINIIVEKSKKIDKEHVIAQCKEILKKPFVFGLFNHEWAYQEIRRKIVIEKLLRDENGDIPKDYKFHIFHGKCQLIEIFFERFTKNRKRSMFDRSWNYLDVGWNVREWKKGGFVKKPENLETMINLAERLGSPFDYIRVDLYSVEGQIFFGELTNYPASGISRFDPQSFDFELGSKWNLTSNYWKRNYQE